MIGLSVSYTHLDVYKRQELTSGIGAILEYWNALESLSDLYKLYSRWQLTGTVSCVIHDPLEPLPHYSLEIVLNVSPYCCYNR